MPFVKRSVEPQLLCRHHPAPRVGDGALFEDLCSISNLALSRTLRQLSDLARHACSIFQELENEVLSTHQRVRGLQSKISHLQLTTSELDAKQEAVPVSDLDVESKLTFHYQAPWTPQRNFFLPSTRPACLEELHHRAHDHTPSLQIDHQQRRTLSRERRVTICVSVAPPAGDYPSPHSPLRGKHRARSVSTLTEVRDAETQLELTQFDTHPSPTDCCHFSPWSRKVVRRDPDSELVLLGQRSRVPVPNTPSTLDRQTNWSSALPLPTPAQRMKSDSQVINSCVIPINVTGVGFDRDASVRCSLVHSQSLLQRRRKLRRRRTVTGVPRQVHHSFDSDESPSSTDGTPFIHPSPDTTTCSEALSRRLSTTRDSGCQTEDFPASYASARRRLRAQRGPGSAYALSVSAGNVSALPERHRRDLYDLHMFAAPADGRSRSLPRDTSRLTHRDEDEEEEEEEEELTPFDAEDFLSGDGGELALKEEEEEEEGEGSADEERPAPGRQRGGLGYPQHAGSRRHGWLDRARSGAAHMGSGEMSSSSDTFSSPLHSGSAALGGAMDPKDDPHMDHQSSSGNWSGSSSTCPSHTSENLPPAASPQLTGSSHCNSELSLNAAGHAPDEALDLYPPGLRPHRTGSFSSAAMDILEDAAGEGDWGYPPEGERGYTPEPLPPRDLSPGRQEAEGSLGCPSFTSMATCESSFSDKPASEKADAVSHYSVDTEGYYTSMHFDCGLKESRSFPYGSASASECGTPDLGDRRCLSLRKARAKPSPPQRSSSLRQICSEENVSEPRVSCGQRRPASSKEMRPDLAPGGPGTPSLVVEPPEEAWGLEDGDGLQDAGSCSSAETQSFKDDGAVRTDYADLWLLNDLKTTDTYRSLSNSSTATGTTVVECVKSPESSGSQGSQGDSRATTPSLPSGEFSEAKLPSPDPLVGLASPSSGYSSQAETPTSALPSAFFPSPLSPPNGKRKPKVPERKSSLSSLQFRSPRDGGSSSKTALELPVVPPSDLDLSGLRPGPGPSALDLRGQMQLLKRGHKQRAPGRSGRSCKSEVPPMRLMSITPTVLHSIQLRSFSREPEKTLNHRAARDPPLSLFSPPGGGEPSEVRGHPVYASFVPSSFGESYKPPPPLPSKEPAPGERARPSDVIDRHPLVDAAPASIREGGADRRPEGQPPRGPAPDLLCPAEETPPPPETLLEEKEEEEEEEEEEPPYLGMTSPGRAYRQEHAAESQEGPADSCPSESCPSESCPSETSPSESCPSETSPSESCPSDSSPPGPGTEAGLQDESLGSSWSSSPDADDGSSKGSSSSGNVTSSPSEDSVTSPVMSSASDEARSGDDSVFQSPSRTRTTEDLFAVIHRSKRKVLGRRDSAEPGPRGRLGAASGATPPAPSSTPPGTPTPPPAPPPPASPASPPQKAPSPIYRSVKKSSTSNEEFKLLLLRKGSRSDSSYRMSASEILRSPVGPRAPGDPPGADEPLSSHASPLSPFEQRLRGAPLPEAPLGPLPRANAEGFSPKASPPGARGGGRPRAPPPATSSRYAARCRFFAAPMQAISEGEGEGSDGGPPDDRPSSGGS